MVKVSKTERSLAFKHKAPKLPKEFQNSCDTKSVAIMVERFVQSIANVNDSGSFDTSFEVKTIQQKPAPQYIRHRCVTELDRESLNNFVKDFEAKQKMLSTPKPKISEHLDIISLLASTPVKKTSLDITTMRRKESALSTDSDIGSSDCGAGGTDEGSNNTSSPRSLYINQNDNLHAPSQTCKSASKVLQFFSSAKKKVQTLSTPSRSKCKSATASPVMMRAHLGCKPLYHYHNDTDADGEDNDDGISLTGSCSASRNTSPDSSFEMQPPLVPTFKITPPRSTKMQQRNPAYELARIIRGSFHAKRASVSKLRRTLSVPDNNQISKGVEGDIEKENKNKFVMAKKQAHGQQLGRGVVGDATIKNLDVIRSRALPSEASPFRRWAQSSFRAPKTTDSQISLSRRPSSLTASDNDVYKKSMATHIGDLKAAAAAVIAAPAIAARNQVVDVRYNIANGHVNSSNRNSSASQQEAQPNGVASWVSSFEKLLEDPAGLHTFAEFLKKEFSAENIYFWTACERYRFIESPSERAANAMDIYSKHLASGASEPVNVDSQARTTAEENLKTAEKDLFAQAQKQIFNLMKFDSYQRFIRSDMYKKCIEAEEKHQPLPYSAEGLDELLKTNFHLAAQIKLKKSASNAENHRRKSSLLPWHRKTRCKSRDRAEIDSENNGIIKPNTKTNKCQQHTGNSLKITSANGTYSASDVHSSRSSLSSFDNLPHCTLANTDDIKASCLCRLILCDGATTIAQTKPDETVRQLVERLLEKRGIVYQLFEVIFKSTNKLVDLDAPSSILAGEELLIEQKVTFKLDLPDPKVISVKSKPKKILCDVIKPILHKYNYCMDNVRILMRDTQDPVDLQQTVTIADGQRLQVILLKNDHSEQNLPVPASAAKQKALPKSVSFPAIKPHRNGSVPSVVITASSKTTLDEITNKVFNELMQGKVESQDGSEKLTEASSLKSDDCASETSSIFGRIRRRDSNIPGLKGLRSKKINKISISQSDDALTTSTQLFSTNSDPTVTTKKPVIAKWKAGVKVLVTEHAEKQDEFLEGLKRAQRARLEDQRGTEINFELPDFLKNKENQSAANKLRKIRANLSPVNKTAPALLDTYQQNDRSLPQPAPRISITKKQSISPMKIDEEDATITPVSPHQQVPGSISADEDCLSAKGPPPLPPKPKVLPIKPSNWGQSNAISNSNSKPIVCSSSPVPSKIPIDISRKHLGSEQTGRTAYLDEPSSSFV